MKITSKNIYLDNASSTRIDDRVLSEMLPYFSEYYGNASSNHDYGKSVNKAIENARLQIAKTINCNNQEIIFTSGATESINLALKGFTEFNVDKGNHIITVKTEHKAVLSTCEYLETIGYEVTYLNVDKNGLINLNELKESIRNTTILIAIMYVNNETGVIQPIKQIGEIARNNHVTFFCDATQAVGKINIDVDNEYIDMLCFSGHKMNGPKGIGVLYKKRGIDLTPLIHGGSQEKGLRSGTYNTPSIIGLGKACELTTQEMIEVNIQLKILNNYLIECIDKITSFNIVSNKDLRVSNIINLIIPGLESDVFIGSLKNIALSNGSACNSELLEESHVLKAIKPDNFYRNNSLRISLDKFSSKEDIDLFCSFLKKHLKLKHA